MILIRALGALEVHTDRGALVRSPIFQPKRTAVLAYLALARPRGFHRRDTLHALLWPELSQARARVALNKTIHELRSALGADALPGRGGGEIGFAWDRVTCDVHAFESALEAGDLNRALDLYRGELLHGLHVTHAQEFEQWLERERRRLAVLASEAASRRAEEAETSGDLDAALRWSRAALRMFPDDEASLRILMRTLDRSGDRAGALREYDAFARQLTRTYGIDVSDETRALADALRERAMGEDDVDFSFRAVTENLADLVTLIDASGKIRYISPAVEPLTGLATAEMIGRSMWDFIHPEDVEFLKARAASRIRGEADPASFTEIRMLHRDGSSRLLQLRGRRHIDPKSRQPMVLVVARDITQMREMERLRRQFFSP